jgi:transcriptional regulator with XRE-family HTH domain
MADPTLILLRLGATLRRVRIEQDISQEELSLRTGVHRNYIGGIERAERNPSVVTVLTLANALGIAASELFRQAERRT